MFQYMTLVFAIIAGIAGTIAAATVSAVNALRKENNSLKQSKEEAIKTLKSEVLMYEALLADAIKRREQVIVELKKNLEAAEADLAQCSSPAAVRQRLSMLFP